MLVPAGGGGANMALCLETKLKAREECTLQLRQTDLDWLGHPFSPGRVGQCPIHQNTGSASSREG